jgi:hypothetical protein
MSASAKKLVSRVKQTRTAGGGYGPHFMKIVAAVDALDSNLKRVRQAKAAIEAIRKLAAQDPDVAELEGLSKYAPEQQGEFLEKAIDAVDEAIKELSHTYDEANRIYLKFGLK